MQHFQSGTTSSVRLTLGLAWPTLRRIPTFALNMLYYSIKLFISALLVLAISEVAKRHTGLAALLASLPLTSLLAFIWLHVESTPNEQLALLSGQIFWLVLPSLVLFLTLPLLLRAGVNFWLSLLLAVAATALCYFAMLSILKRYGITL